MDPHRVEIINIANPFTLRCPRRKFANLPILQR